MYKMTQELRDFLKNVTIKQAMVSSEIMQWQEITHDISEEFVCS